MKHKKVYCKKCMYYKRPVDVWLIPIFIIIIGLIMVFIPIEDMKAWGVTIMFFGGVFTILSLLFVAGKACKKGIEKKVIYNDYEERDVVYETLSASELNKKNDCGYYQKK